MLNQAYQDYLSDSYIELYTLMQPAMKFIKFDSSAGKTAQGKLKIKFLEDTAFDVHGSLRIEDNENADLSVKGDVRADIEVALVLKEFTAKSVFPALNDALDIYFPQGTKRYIITGFASPPAPAYLFVSPILTELDKAFK